MCSERLRRYRELINYMPVKDQTTISNIENVVWQRYREYLAPVLEQFRACDGGRFVEISRADLFELAGKGISHEFVYAVFIWGYPTGGRGNNFSRVIHHIDEIKNVFARAPGAMYQDDLNQLRARLRGCGIGLATWTKLLYFLGFTVEGDRALILDRKVARAFQRQLFEQFRMLGGITYDNGEIRDQPDIYPNYLRIMSKVAQDLGVDSDKLEMFLFVFGSSLKSHC